MIRTVSYRAAIALGALALGLAPLAVRAQTPAPASARAAMANVPCSSAAAAMRASAAMPEPHVAKPDVDATYEAMMAEHAKAMMAMSALERRCGSDAKMKDGAERDERAARAVLDTLHVF